MLLLAIYFPLGVARQLAAIVLRHVHTLTSQLIEVKDAEFGIVRCGAIICWWLLFALVNVASAGLLVAIRSAKLTRNGVVDDF